MSARYGDVTVSKYHGRLRRIACLHLVLSCVKAETGAHNIEANRKVQQYLEGQKRLRPIHTALRGPRQFAITGQAMYEYDVHDGGLFIFVQYFDARREGGLLGSRFLNLIFMILFPGDSRESLEHVASDSLELTRLGLNVNRALLAEMLLASGDNLRRSCRVVWW